ncbi:MAG TPA: transcriptional repressor [Rhodopila sp.]|jgi:Fur family zinc uptake transcriptional regulator|nr:transcriptional repressor [Rhodopila sp.]
MGFSPRTESLLNRANGICDGRGVRLTDLRRQVLGLILDREAPTGAYDLLDQLRATRHGAAPPTVYRALEFLLEQGLIHKLERLSAFVGCIADEDHHEHAAQFFICRTCGKVTELEDHELSHALEHAARRLGFTLGKATIEAEGQCASCAKG